MMRMMVWSSDDGEQSLQQVEGINASNNHQKLVNIVKVFLRLIVIMSTIFM